MLYGFEPLNHLEEILSCPILHAVNVSIDELLKIEHGFPVPALGSSSVASL